MEHTTDLSPCSMGIKDSELLYAADYSIAM